MDELHHMLFTCSRACYMIHVPRRKFIPICLSSSVSFSLHAILILLLNWKGTGECKCARLCVRRFCAAAAVSVHHVGDRMRASEPMWFACGFYCFVLLPPQHCINILVGVWNELVACRRWQIDQVQSKNTCLCDSARECAKCIKSILSNNSHNNHVICVCSVHGMPLYISMFYRVWIRMERPLKICFAIVNKIAYNHAIRIWPGRVHL